MSADERHLGQLPMLGFLPLKLVEHQISQRVEDQAATVDFDRLRDVRVVAYDQCGAGIYGGMGEGNLRRSRRFQVLDAVMHGDNDDVASFSKISDIAEECSLVDERDARIDIAPVSIRLIVGIAEKSEPNALARQDGAEMRFSDGRAASDGGDTMRPQPGDGEQAAVWAAIARVIIRR